MNRLSLIILSLALSGLGCTTVNNVVGSPNRDQPGTGSNDSDTQPDNATDAVESSNGEKETDTGDDNDDKGDQENDTGTRRLDTEGRMRGDPEKLRRVLINLIGNALDALEEAGTPAPALSIEALTEVLTYYRQGIERGTILTQTVEFATVEQCWPKFLQAEVTMSHISSDLYLNVLTGVPSAMSQPS